jgi:hypothetical protein
MQGQMNTDGIWHWSGIPSAVPSNCAVIFDQLFDHHMQACSNGIPLEIIDTPGLIGAASGSAANAAVVRQIKK